MRRLRPHAVNIGLVAPTETLVAKENARLDSSLISLGRDPSDLLCGPGGSFFHVLESIIGEFQFRRV